MAVLASFVKFKIDFSAGSGSLSTAEEGQFSEKRTLTPGPVLGYYSQHLFEMTNFAGAFTTRERGMFGIHWINLTAGEVDTSWIAADYASVETAVETFWSGVGPFISNTCRLVEHRWYAFGVNVGQPNPPSRVTTLGSPAQGTATGSYVHQVCCTVTLRTAVRRHWGRIYLPSAANLWSANGQATSANTDSIASMARTMFMVTPTAQGVVPVVWDRSRKLAFGVSAVEVDSVPDIQRRRRPRDTGYKKIFTS